MGSEMPLEAFGRKGVLEHAALQIIRNRRLRPEAEQLPRRLRGPVREEVVDLRERVGKLGRVRGVDLLEVLLRSDEGEVPAVGAQHDARRGDERAGEVVEAGGVRHRGWATQSPVLRYPPAR